MGEAAIWNRNFRILCAGQFLVTAGLTVVVPLLPFYLEQLGAVSTEMNMLWSGLSLAAPAIPLTLAAPFWGRLGDRYGRKLMVVRALFGIAFSMILLSLARTPLQFFVARLLQGAFGGIDNAAASFASTQTPPEIRGKVLGGLQTATAAGALIGPLAGGLLSDRYGFSPLILSIGILIGVGGLCAAWGMREKKGSRQAIAAAVPLRTITSHLLGRYEALSFVLAGLCAQVGSYGMVTIFAIHVRELLADPRHASGVVGALQAVTLTATLIGATWWGRHNDRHPLKRNFVIASLGCALSVALQSLPSQAGWLFPLRFMQGFCVSAIGQSVYLQVSRGLPPEHQGGGIGVANSFLTLGQVIGSLTGGILSAYVSAAWVFISMGCIHTLGAVLVLLARNPDGEQSRYLRLEGGKTIS
jgi:MFS transporter, DHA1 family, staphyloferrin B biosynthesis exporter